MSEECSNDDGRKILFFFFSPDTEEKLLKRIASFEYEVYSISDPPDRYIKFIRENPNAIIFTNGSNCPKNSNWRDNFLLLSSACADHDIKISTWVRKDRGWEHDPELTNFSPPVRLINPGEGYEKISEYILSFLKKHNARGRRTFVRIRCDDCYSATFSVKHHKEIHNGTILDISTVAIACTFADNIELKVDTRFDDIQLRLGGHISPVSGTVFRKRDIGGKTVYVILFDIKKHPETHARISDYIYHCLQKRIETEKEQK
jgi:hypothetical protein